jgi:DNA repair and recombination RAD54-like protein
VGCRIHPAARARLELTAGNTTIALPHAHHPLRPHATRRCRKKYESPILAAREPWATDRQKAEATAASSELSNIVNQFILRRTNTLLSKHLPPKLLQVVCVRMAPLQQQLYTHFLEGQRVAAILSGRSSGVLASITALRKLVNHPRLVYDAMRAQKTGAARNADSAAGFEDCEQYFPDSFHRDRSACEEMSGKFELTARMLTMLRNTTTDRIVIVSCYTQTLDLFTALCREHVSALCACAFGRGLLVVCVVLGGNS